MPVIAPVVGHVVKPIQKVVTNSLVAVTATKSHHRLTRLTKLPREASFQEKWL